MQEKDRVFANNKTKLRELKANVKVLVLLPEKNKKLLILQKDPHS